MNIRYTISLISLGNARHFYRDINYEAISEEQFFSHTLPTFLIPLDPRSGAKKKLQRAILRRST